MFPFNLFIQVSRGSSEKFRCFELLFPGLLDKTRGNILDYLFGSGNFKPLENNININLGSQAIPSESVSHISNLQEAAMVREFLSKNGRETIFPQSLVDLLLDIAKDDRVGDYLKSQL